MGQLSTWIKEQKEKKMFLDEFNERKKLMQSDIDCSTNDYENEKNKVKELKYLLTLDSYERRKSYINKSEYFRNWQKTMYQQKFLQTLISNDEKLKEYITTTEDECLKRKYRLELKKKKFEFLRPNTKEDIQERQNALKTFTGAVQSLDKNNTLNLRFHSTNIAATKDIIESGGLIASVDRLNGYQFDTGNHSNEISVTDIYGMQHSVESWTDLNAHQENLPSGCLFVLKPSSQEEINMIQHRCMHNVYFNENDRLIGIVTTSENLPYIQKWLNEKGLDTSLVSTFEQFPSQLKERFSLNHDVQTMDTDDIDR